MPATHYSATFANGQRITRTTAPSSTRTYTHAWRVSCGEPNPGALAAGWRPGGHTSKPSFAGSRDLAYAAANTYANGRRLHYTDVVVEVVPVAIHATRKQALGS